MADIIDRAQLRKETDRLKRSSNVSTGEALHAVLNRKGEGDYVLKTGDEDVKSAVQVLEGKVPHGLVPGAFHKIEMNTSGSTEDVYTYHMDDSSTVVVTVRYEDSTKANITEVERV